jgi:MGT family glycosyltransferase
MRFLFAMWDGGGNVPPTLGLARRLLARGHLVRVLGDPTLGEAARLAGAEHTSWRLAPHRKGPDDIVIRDFDAAPPLTMIRDYIDSFIGRPARHWMVETLAALESWRADALVADMSIPAAFIAGERLGIPSAAICPNIWMLPTPGIPPLGPGWAPARGPLGSARDALARAIMNRAFSRATPCLNAARAQVGLSGLATFREHMLRADQVYVLTSPRFDFTSPAMPVQVRYGGPVLDDPAWCEPWSPPWPAGDTRPLVLVSLSSTYQRQGATLRRIVESLSSLAVRGLVTLGPVIPLDEVPGGPNVAVVRAAPHTEVLRQAALLVTHCGHGTTMRGLVAGVPLVCIPMGRDQNDTAARIVHHGAGVRLGRQSSAVEIRAAIARVLGDASYRHQATELGRAIADGEGCVDVVTSLERLAAGDAGARSGAGTVPI